MSNCYREEVYKVTTSTICYLRALNNDYHWDWKGRRCTDFGGGVRVRGDLGICCSGHYIVVSMTVRNCCMGLEYYAPLGVASYNSAEKAFELVDYLMECEPKEYEVWEVVDSYDYETLSDRLPHYTYVYDEYCEFCCENLKTGQLTPMTWLDRFVSYELDALVDYEWEIYDFGCLVNLLTVCDRDGVRRWLPVTHDEVSAALEYSVKKAGYFDEMPF